MWPQTLWLLLADSHHSHEKEIVAENNGKKYFEIRYCLSVYQLQGSIGFLSFTLFLQIWKLWIKLHSLAEWPLFFLNNPSFELNNSWGRSWIFFPVLIQSLYSEHITTPVSCSFSRKIRKGEDFMEHHGPSPDISSPWQLDTTQNFIIRENG